MNLRSVFVAALGVVLAAAPCLGLPQTTETPGSQTDQIHVAADQANALATQLYAQKTSESVRKGIAKSEEALALYQQAGDRAKQAEVLAMLGSASLIVGEKAKAAEFLRQSLALVRELGHRNDEAVVLNMLASAYETNKDLKLSQDAYKQTLTLCRELKNTQCQAAALMGLGRVAFAAGDKETSLNEFGQAVPLWRTLGDRQNQASADYMVAVLNGLLNQKASAIPYYLEALPLYRDLGNKFWVARILLNLAEVYAAVGNQAKAGNFFDQAIPALQAVGDQSEEATALMSRSLLYEDWGQMGQAASDLIAAQKLFHSVNNQLMEAAALLRLGIISYEAGEHERSLDFYQQTLKLARSLNNSAMQAAALTGVSSIYLALGDDDSALKYCEDASKLMPIKGSQADPDALYRLGVTYISLRQYQRALEWLSQAVQLEHQRGDRLGEARGLQTLAGIYDVAGKPQQALPLYQQALDIREAIGDRRSKAQSLTSVGTMYAELSQPERAVDYYQKALEIYRAVHDRNGESMALFWAAKSERALNDLVSARRDIESSLAITESERSTITSPEFRTSYLAKAQYAYEFYVDVLMQENKVHPGQGYDGKALEAHERAKARGLLDLLTEANVDIHQGVDPELLQREAQVRQQMEEKQSAEVRLLSEGEEGDQFDQLHTDLEALRAQYQQVETQIRNNSPRYAGLTQPQPLSLAQIQKEVLDDKTVLLEYALGEQQSYLWVVTRTGLRSFELPARSEIEKSALRLYRTIIGKAPVTVDYQTLATSLSSILLAPAREMLANKRIAIVSDGVLQIVPFAALPSPGVEPYEPLIVRHEVISVPSASTVALLRRDEAGRHLAPKKVAVFADPVFDSEDDRVAKLRPAVQTEPSSAKSVGDRSALADTVATASANALGLERLSFSRVEAEDILSLVPPQSRFAALDFVANRSNATSPELAQYQVIHFATHGVVDDAHPELSGIVLSLVDKQGQPQDGFLRLNDLFNLKLNAELVVLSACKTALGKEVRGEGFIGLARGFMYAGAPRVVVSLWSVSDQATTEEMKRFYAGMFESKHLRPAEALRQAQIEMWKQEKWHSPFLWAAFVLEGDWK